MTTTPVHLDELRDESALRMGRPCLVATAGSEEALLRAAGALEAVLGRLPQAELLEPEGETGPWSLRAELPAITPFGWALARDRLRAEGVGLHLEPADPPGVTEALDRGWLVADVVEADGLRARWLRDPDDRRRPDLHRPQRADPWLRPLGAALAAAIRSVRSDLDPCSDLGPDTVAPVVHRPSGRAGVELSLPSEAGDPLPARREILAALGSVVRALGLCPDLEWEAPLGGLTLRLWLAVPAGPGLPGDEVFDPSASDPLPAWLGDLVGWSEHAELQVVPHQADRHDELAAALGPFAELLGFGGGPSRWVSTPRGPVFCPAWRVPATAEVEALATLRGTPGVAGFRLCPGPPAGLEDAWPAVDPVWRTTRGVGFCRWPDAVHDRDRLEQVLDRTAEPRDHHVADATSLELRPIVDTAGRHGLELTGGSSTLAEQGLNEALDALAALRHPELGALGSFGFGRAGVVARRWWREPLPDRPPTFSTRFPGS